MSPLTVTMLGGFTLTYEGRRVDLLEKKRTIPIALKFLLLLWLRGKEGLTEDEAILCFLSNRRNSDIRCSLNYLTTAARSILKDAGLPPMRYVLRKGGAFYPDPNVLIDLDVNAFRDYVEQTLGGDGTLGETMGPAGLGPQGESACRKAIEFYRGPLLPELSDEEWVRQEAGALADMYREVTERLARIERDRGGAEEGSSLYETAALASPERNWEARQLEALLLQGRDREAAQLYERTITRYLQSMKGVRSGRILAGTDSVNGRIIAFAKEADEIFRRVRTARKSMAELPHLNER